MAKRLVRAKHKIANARILCTASPLARACAGEGRGRLVRSYGQFGRRFLV
jgi:hypothetical protein